MSGQTENGKRRPETGKTEMEPIARPDLQSGPADSRVKRLQVSGFRKKELPFGISPGLQIRGSWSGLQGENVLWDSGTQALRN